jgi:hypothetical protein
LNRCKPNRPDRAREGELEKNTLGRATVMIVEMRTYTFHPGKAAEFVRLYLREGFEVQKRILGNLLGYYSTETGTLNQFIHLWGYESLEDRLTRRTQLFSDPGWLQYLERVLPLIQTQENKILIPTSFSPVR